MKKELLIKNLEELAIPDRLLKVDDADLKHANRRIKSKLRETVQNNLFVILGMPAIDKEYNDSDVHSELSIFTDGITDATWRYLIFAMVRLNAYIKTKILPSKFKSETYKLKKRIVRMIVKYAPEYIVETNMHVRFDENSGEDEYFVQYTLLNRERNSMIHQPLHNVEKLYSKERVAELIANAVLYDNSEPAWEFERTEEERISILKMFSHLTLGVMIIEKHFGIDNYFSN